MSATQPMPRFTADCEHCGRGLIVTQEEWDDICIDGLALLCEDCLVDNG